MNRSTRIIHNDNGVLYDHSVALNDYISGTASIHYTKIVDFIYIGCRLPFNHIFFEVSIANAVTAVPTVQIWWANAWHDAIDVVDETSSGGKTLAVSGSISWITDNLKGWDVWSYNDTDAGFASLKIYDLYWIRLKFSDDLTNPMAWNYVGHKFSTDNDLYSHYPDLNNSTLKTAYKAGKTTWDEQHYAAAQEIEKDLIAKNVILDKSQIHDPFLFKKPSVDKVAQIIYSGLGKDFEPNATKAYLNYQKSLDLKQFRVDNHGTGQESRQDLWRRTGCLYR